MSEVKSALLAQSIRLFEPYFKIKGVVELCINQPHEIWIETMEGWIQKKDAMLTLPNLVQFGQLLATVRGQEFSEYVPLLSTSLPGYGYRVQCCGSALIASGFAMTMRIAQARRFDLEMYFDKQAPAEPAPSASEAEIHFDSDQAKILNAVVSGKNILVAGGTSSGKTTLTNSLIRYIPDETRIVVVEDTMELVVDQPNNVRYVKSKTGTDTAKVTYKDIINSCMRMRPDRIIVGELDIENTVPFLRLLNTGHGGSLATVHADGPEEAIEAICMNAQLAGLHGPIEKFARNALHHIVFIKRHDRKTFVARLYDVN